MGEYESNMKYAKCVGDDTRKPEFDRRSTSQLVTDEMNRLRGENKKLRIAARLIHQRGQVASGSKEMADIDSFCKGVNLRVWEWPLGDFWDYDNL
uniref:Uncharacterized protein n=1 Tax=viral metagenome TaxID=1070528 RepID=A0A6M3KD69_9ZZZZ